ncbi:MAG: DUF1570 domain-containing protein, partial [Planctomycetota bacterium]|nr:DUF1570 domain-containing protein [Planctomycetota bacterium]
YRLGMWCLERGMREQAKEEFMKALALEAGHKGAKEEIEKMSREDTTTRLEGKKGRRADGLPDSFAEYRREGFVLVSDVEAKTVEKLVDAVRVVEAVLGRIYGCVKVKDERRGQVTIVVFAKRESLNEFAEKKGLFRRIGGGFWIEDREDKTTMVAVCMEEKEVLRDIVRCVVWEVIDGRFGLREASWLYEGSVRLFEEGIKKSVGESGKFDVVLTNRDDFCFLKSQIEAVSLEEMLLFDYENGDGGKKRLLGVASEFFLRFLLQEEEKRFERYLERLRSGGDLRDSFEEVFGSFEKLKERFVKVLDALSVTLGGRLVCISRDAEAGRTLKDLNKIPHSFEVWRAGEFLLATDVEEERAVEYGALMCELLESVKKSYGGLLKRNDRGEMLVLLFKEREDYRKFMVADGVLQGKDSYGYYSGVNHKSYIFECGAMTRKYIFHECMHQIYVERMVTVGGARTSLWFFEGMAEYSEGAVTDSSVEWGSVHKENLYIIQDALRQKRAFGLRRMFVTEKFEELFKSDYESEECKIAYAQAWAVFYYLMEKHRERLMRYIKSEGEGAGGVARFEQVFGNVEKVENDWNAFVLSLR